MREERERNFRRMGWVWLGSATVDLQAKAGDRGIKIENGAQCYQPSAFSFARPEPTLLRY